MRNKELLSLGDVYGGMLNSVKKNINESVGPGGKSLDEDDASKLINGGPSEKGGYKKALNDECDEEDEEEEDFDLDEQEETPKKKSKKVVKESAKNQNQKINTLMKKTSVFDKLYTKVINENWGIEDAEDIDALGLGDATPDSDLDDDFGDESGDVGDESGDEVTITIDKATAQTLIDLLQGALGGEEDLGDEVEGEDDLDFDDEDASEFNFDEDEETYGTKTNAPDKKKVFQTKNNKVGGKVKPHGGKASSDVTDDIGDDGDFGHAISSPKKVNDGKQNKVGNLSKGADFFK